jgi:hypothetical protein
MANRSGCSLRTLQGGLVLSAILPAIALGSLRAGAND